MSRSFDEELFGDTPIAPPSRKPQLGRFRAAEGYAAKDVPAAPEATAKATEAPHSGLAQTVALQIWYEQDERFITVQVPGTCTIKVVREALVKLLDVKSGPDALKIRHKLDSKRIRDLADEEPLAGRHELLVSQPALDADGEPERQFTVDDALQIQQELMEAYGNVEFQAQLDGLLAEFPYPGCLKSGQFRVRFGNLVQAAQRDTLRSWGFEGPAAVSSMLEAFRPVLQEPPVVENVKKLDNLMRFTINGSLPGVQEIDDLERDVEIKSAVQDGPALTVRVPGNATFANVRQELACCLGLAPDDELAAAIRFVYWSSKSRTWEPFSDDGQLGALRELLVLDTDLPALAAAGQGSRRSRRRGAGGSRDAIPVSAPAGSTSGQAPLWVQRTSLLYSKGRTQDGIL
eukprot:gnl/TRDRNA2_/TRDRNA2_80864_c0_seq1.p1 gnl/TRDRNA2_/TRDRNA2_80864_c0~~gnl/TRDRNA2_/TRDRNA2_80864_c0_seq1.p1  ORF type:complete len:403 (+),score=70.57 gnl/TRDRNA2_/TRDRNA2_80864_c0_seq1:51-1259(+)